MDTFPWWTDEQKAYQDELCEYVNKLMPRAEEAYWERRFPWDIVKEVGEKGYFGAGVPKEYGGMGLGVTGCCITAEQLGRLYCIGHIFVVSHIGGYHQILHHGTEEQKKKWLSQLAKGVIGAVCITEPYYGSDAAGIETVAVRDGDEYILNGKKRFITGGGVADRYIVYARTSDDPEDRRRYRHLSAFVVEKGMDGFTLEKINELIGFENVPNAYLDFDNVRVPVENRIGNEGDGWAIMMGGLNFERTIAAAVTLGGMIEGLRCVYNYVQRRVQFRMRTTDFVNNQFAIADMIADYKLARLMTYYAAYAMDIGMNIPVEASIAKMFATDASLRMGVNGVQIVGGDGLTKFYPIERMVRESKIGQIVAGTNEIMKVIIYRMGPLAMYEDLKYPWRYTLHPRLQVPMPTFEKSEFAGKEPNEENMLKLFALNYRVNPGLHMTIEDIANEFEAPQEKVLETLQAMESKGLASLYRDRKGRILLARPTYEGLKQAAPKEYYKWFPSWYRDEDKF
ncbi:MAG: acyl-CoA dehydrogenase family protein [Candidatus Freyarchaeota archaeon]|nr:acyl-CoA dehydrogenase [Candidatus Bathyarchaeota archaeon]